MCGWIQIQIQRSTLGPIDMRCSALRTFSASSEDNFTHSSRYQLTKEFQTNHADATFPIWYKHVCNCSPA
jgi:hypothetical protein